MADVDPGFRAIAEELISRIDSQVRAQLERLKLVAPAYAVVLAPLYDIHPFTVGVGLETDRARALSSLPRQIAFSSVWQQYEFAVFEELDEDTEIAELIAKIEPELDMPEVADGLDATQFVLYNVARRLTLNPPCQPVTDDFVAFVAYQGDIGDFLLDSLRYSTSPEIADRLRAKGLHPDDYERWVRESVGTEAAEPSEYNGQRE
jgi:hypothetical protein